MTEQKPENKWVTAAKLVGVCITCIAVIYGLVVLVTAFST